MGIEVHQTKKKRKFYHFKIISEPQWDKLYQTFSKFNYNFILSGRNFNIIYQVFDAITINKNTKRHHS